MAEITIDHDVYRRLTGTQQVHVDAWVKRQGLNPRHVKSLRWDNDTHTGLLDVFMTDESGNKYFCRDHATAERDGLCTVGAHEADEPHAARRLVQVHTPHDSPLG